MSAHPWRLVAPWYLQQRRQPGVAPRDTRPELQKYETSQLVDLFRADPQHSLKFTLEDESGGARKLYLAQHKRFYLVVCELHCDRRGFPNAGREEVCEMGFVLRRWRTPMPVELQKEATRILLRIGRRKAQIAMLEDRLSKPSSGGPVAVAKVAQFAKRAARAHERLAALHGELDEFAATNQLAPVLEAWVPSEIENVGEWTSVESDDFDAGAEQSFPLYPLIPDPHARPHAARGRSIFYGLVPTAISDTVADGSPRLEEKMTYDVRCFVRRHDPCCPRKPGRRDCRGELTWSGPTDQFTLASPQDLVGTSNRPVTVALPNIPELMDQAKKLPFGVGAPLRMASPAKSSLPVAFDKDGKAKGGAPPDLPQICSFAIPLITIIAYFVLRLFLPIVVLLFGLWFLLKLKFCIFPSVDVSADVSAELQASKAGLEVDAGVKAKIQGGLGVMPGNGYDGKYFSAMADALSLPELLDVYQAQRSKPGDPGFELPPRPAGAVPSPNAALAPLIWEEPLEIPELDEVPA